MTSEEVVWIREFYTLTSDARQHECYLEIQEKLGRVPNPADGSEKTLLLQKRCIDLLIGLGELQEKREDEERMVEEKEGSINLFTPCIVVMVQGSIVGFCYGSIGLTMCVSVVGALMGSLYTYKPRRNFYLEGKRKELLHLLKKLTQ